VLNYRLRRAGAYILTATSLTLAAGCAAPAPETSALAPAVPALATAAPTLVAGWSAFTEPTLGYTISFPADTVIMSGSSPAGVHTTRLQFRVPGVDGYQGMLIRVEPNPEGRGLEEVVGKLYEDYLLGAPPADLLARLPQQTVAGLTAGRLGSGGDFSLVLPVGDYVYIIAPVHDLTATQLDPKALELFYQVLATLKVSQ
jgi:hypothetical protein